MDRVDSIAVFAEVADRGSFSAAARRLNRSPAAVTRAVAELGEGGWRVAVIWECALRGDRAAKATNELCDWLLGSGPRFETEPTTRNG